MTCVIYNIAKWIYEYMNLWFLTLGCKTILLCEHAFIFHFYLHNSCVKIKLLYYFYKKQFSIGKGKLLKIVVPGKWQI